ncbi:MAG TPA: sigma factor [Alcanivorax sp.]|nr:sigma factor [Alcanivorax sp.]
MANADLETPEFIERLRAGDRTAFALVVKHYHPRLLGAARTLLQPADAEEAVQEAWVAAYRALPQFEGRSALLTWLTRIVINQARMQLRKSGREVRFDPTEEGGADALAERIQRDASH